MKTPIQNPLFIPILAFGVVSLAAQPKAPFQEFGGQVVIEAENFDERMTDDADNKHWHVVPDDDGADFLGDDAASAGIDYSISVRPGNLSQRGTEGYITSLPDAGQNQNASGEIPDSTPWIDYKVDIKTIGEYQLYLRWTGWDGASDSIYARVVELAGNPVNWYRYAGGASPFDSDFATGAGGTGWDGIGEPDGTSASGNEVPAVWNVDSPGVYTLRIQQREDGSGVDALIFQLSNLPPPEGIGPMESPRGTLEPEPLKILGVTPAADSVRGAFDRGIRVLLLEGTTTLDDSSVTLTLDGANVQATIERVDNIATVSFVPEAFFRPNSAHAAQFSAKDSAGADVSRQWSWITRDYISIPADWSVTADTSKSGFRARVHQVDFDISGNNTIARAEAQLAGEVIDPNTGQPSENFVFPEDFGPDGFAKVNPTVINMNQDAFDNPAASEGNFGPDDPIPGIPGLTAGGTDSIAMEVLAFLDLPAGLVKMGVNSDDGFEVRVSPGNPRDAFGVRLGAFDGGRGAADSNFDFVVEESGIYSFRLVWFEGTGGANVEWFSRDADNNRVLINDRSTAGHVKAYAEGNTPSPYVSSVSPAPGETGVPSDTAIEIVLADPQQQVQAGSVTLAVNGESVTPQVNRSGEVITVSYDPAEDFEGSSVTSVQFQYSDNASPPNVVTRDYSFQIQSSFVYAFQEGVNNYAGTVDTEVVQGQPDAEGSSTQVLNPDGQDRGGEVHVLMRFENIFGDGPSQIPAGSVIREATLTINITGGGNNLNLHRMLIAWEGTSTWADLSSDQFLLEGIQADDTSAAATFDATFSGAAAVRVINLPPQTLQDWLDGASPNLGWVMLPTGTDGVDFSSSEDPNLANRPLLTVTLAEPLYGVRVANGLDDAEEHLTEGNSIDLTSSDLELGAEGGGGDTQEIGIRFQNVNVPPGSIINAAHIQFTVDEADDEPTSVMIYGELSPDAFAYGSTAGNITSRTRTAAVVEWNDIPIWNDASIGTAGPDQRTPDLSSIVQELVNQPGWSANNAMAFVIAPNPGGERTAESFDGDPAAAPLLEIDFSEPPPGGGAGGDATISIASSAGGATITFSGTLQSADSVTGPWTDVAGASSPASITVSGGMKFYRARQ